MTKENEMKYNKIKPKKITKKKKHDEVGLGTSTKGREPQGRRSRDLPTHTLRSPIKMLS